MPAKTSSPLMTNGIIWMFGLTLLVAVQAGAQAPPDAADGDAQTQPRQVAEVTGNDVYVRSGPSTNHYPVIKLDAGVRVTVVGQRSEWYEILPPADAFSLIDSQYVDEVASDRGVVNGNRVNIRAGSHLSDNKSTVQTQLNRGVEVIILGRNPDGFLRIKPPEAAHLWISESLVSILPEDLVRLEQASGAPPTGATMPEAAAAGSTTDDKTAARPVQPSSPLLAHPTADRTELATIDDVARDEMALPLMERKLVPIVDRYRAVAERTDDDFARQYAEKRIEQLSAIDAMIDSIRELRGFSTDVDEKRRAFRQERAELVNTKPPAPAGFDIKGEIRPSALYPAGSRPQRFRIVDPESPSRTSAYIEVPSGSSMSIDPYMGRYVGVRASSKFLHGGATDPVPVFVVRELVILKRETNTVPIKMEMGG